MRRPLGCPALSLQPVYADALLKMCLVSGLHGRSGASLKENCVTLCL